MLAPNETTGAVDALTLSVVRHKLHAVAEEMAQTMAHTCFSAILNLSQDFSSVILDSEARILAQAERLPIHMGAMPWAVRQMADDVVGEIGPNDILMSNDPYYGGSHLPDITLARPVFRDGRLLMWVALRAHHTDIGGISPGGFSPGATEIWHEGIRIPPVKLVDNGVLRRDLLRLVSQNTRRPKDVAGDLYAQMAAVNVGVARLEALLDRYGVSTTVDCGEAILRAGEAAMARELANYQPGTYTGTSYIEISDSTDPIPITVKITIGQGRAIVDLTDCPDQVPAIINSPIANTSAAVMCAFMYLCEEEQSPNGGSQRLIELRTREGSVVHPVMPVPVVASTTICSTVIIEAVLKALAPARSEVAIAGFNRRFRFTIAGRDNAGQPYLWHYFFNRGGGGASAVSDGWPNLGGFHNPGSMPAPSVEHTETAYPLFIEEYALRSNSGGPGRKRGGLGGRMCIRYEGNSPAVFTTMGDGERVRPFGIVGGTEGAGHQYKLERVGAQPVRIGIRDSNLPLHKGDRITCLSAGGGGYGPPQERSAEEVRRDVEFGYLSPETARKDYPGV